MKLLKKRNPQNSLKTVIIPAIAATLFLFSCTPKVAPATAQTATTATANSDKLVQGKTVFENSCAKCHDLPVPTKYTAEKWVGIMNWMAPKAHLTEEQHALVYDYVVSVKK